MPMLIREYESRDAPALRECIVELQNFERTLDVSLPSGSSMADGYLTYLMDRCDAHRGKVFLVEVEAGVVGFVCVWARVDPSEPDEPRTPYAYISDLVVLSSFRGRGFGRGLLAQAETYAREQGTTVIRIGVLANNAVARSLYVQEGFSERRIELSKPLVVTPMHR